MSPEKLGQVVAQAKEFLSKSAFEAPQGVGVLGDMGLDGFVFGSVDRISPEAPVPVLLCEKVLDKPGCAANVAENIAALAKDWNLELSVFGVVGSDDAGERLLRHLKNYPSKSSLYIECDKERPTTLKTRYLAGSQHQLLRVDAESSNEVSDELRSRLLKSLHTQMQSHSLKSLVIQDYAKGLLNPDFAKEVYVLAKKNGVLTIVDPNLRSLDGNYKGADLIKANVQEAAKLLDRDLHKGADNALVATAAREIKSKFGLQAAMITRSAYGMTLVDVNDKIHHFPAISRAVFDVTGAGDTVVSVLASGLARGLSLEVASLLAMAAASVVVAKVGTATASVAEIKNEISDLQT